MIYVSWLAVLCMGQGVRVLESIDHHDSRPTHNFKRERAIDTTRGRNHETKPNQNSFSTRLTAWTP
jgi:hypothetical protein